MAKRKITVTVDEETVALVQDQGEDNLSAVVNAALAEHADRLGRRAALGRLLATWDDRHGAVSARARRDATAAFDELDGVGEHDAGPA